MPWVEDGTNYTEEYMIGYLRDMARTSPELFEKIVEKDWVEDKDNDPHHVEPLVLRYLSHMAHRDKRVALQVIDLPFLETIEWGDSSDVRFLLDLMASDPAGLEDLLAHPEVVTTPVEGPPTPMALVYLATRNAHAASQVANLDWVKDGTEQFEKNGVLLLQELALESPAVFQAVLSRGREWMPPQTGMDNSTIERLIELAAFNEDAALNIIEMPFMESISIADGDAFKRLAELAQSDPAGLDFVLSHPDIQVGVTDARTFNLSLAYLEWTDPEAADLIEEISWVADGIAYLPPSNVSSIYDSMDKFESGAFLDLIDLARRNRPAFVALVNKPWFRGQLTREYYEVYSTLWDLALKVPDATLRIVNMPFLDEVDRGDDGILETISELYWEGSHKIYQLIDHPHLEGGITEENRFIVRLLALELEEANAAEQINDLPWVKDGLAPSEESAVLALVFTARDTDWFFPELITRPWVEDGLDSNEVSAIRNLKSIAGKDNSRNTASVAVALLDMPFLESVEPRDAAALESMSRLIWRGDGELGELGPVLSHPTLDSGITHDDALLVAFLDRARDNSSELLDSGRGWLAARTVELPHTGTVELAVLEEDEGRLETLDLLERTVRAQEGFMRAPLPPSFAGVLVGPYDGGGGPTGIISVHPSLSHDANLIASLAAYTYWPLPHPHWMSGGAVFLLTWATVKGEPEKGMPRLSFECEGARNASDIESQENEASRDRDVSPQVSRKCQFDMGLGLYLDLYSNLGEESFKEGFRRLYYATKWDGNVSCANPLRGLCLFKESFVERASPADADIAAPIIDLWYWGDPLGKGK